MFLVYVDESGDCGLTDSPSPYFALSGVVLHELRWQELLDNMIVFRRSLKDQFGLKLREEFHAAKFLSRPGPALMRIKRHERLAMIRRFARFVGAQEYLSIINVLIEKAGKPETYDVFGTAWRTLIQRFENTLSHRNFSGPANPDDRGMLVCDHTDDKKLLHVLRRMRRYNPVPNRIGAVGYRDLPLKKVIEDPWARDSADSFMIQLADLAAFLLYQYECPNAYMKKKGGRTYFHLLEPVLCKVASSSDPLGIVRL